MSTGVSVELFLEPQTTERQSVSQQQDGYAYISLHTNKIKIVMARLCAFTLLLLAVHRSHAANPHTSSMEEDASSESSVLISIEFTPLPLLETPCTPLVNPPWWGSPLLLPFPFPPLPTPLVSTWVELRLIDADPTTRCAVHRSTACVPEMLPAADHSLSITHSAFSRAAPY